MISFKITGPRMFCLAVPLMIVVAGCNNKNDTTDATSTNAATVGNSENTNPAAGQAKDTNADNSGKNTRDRDNANLTPLDQGSSPADLAVTKNIRKDIVSGTNDFSTMAKNIKIITQDGHVTLRGPVQTDSEKSSLVTLAKSVAGETNVTDQLEVKAAQ